MIIERNSDNVNTKIANYYFVKYWIIGFVCDRM